MLGIAARSDKMSDVKRGLAAVMIKIS